MRHVMTNRLQRLAGKTAIVTGATRGIGKEISLTFAREGANVVVAARNNADISRQKYRGFPD